MVNALRTAATAAACAQAVFGFYISIEPISPSPSPTGVISVTTQDLGKPFQTASNSNPKCQCNEENGFAEMADALGQLVSGVVNLVDGGLEVAFLPALVVDLETSFSNLKNFAKDVNCVSFKTQSTIFELVDKLLNLLHQIFEGVESLPSSGLLNDIVPGLKIITDGLSSLMIQFTGGLSLQPCCILDGSVNVTTGYVDELNGVIDQLNKVLVLKIPEVATTQLLTLNDNIIHNCTV